MVNYSHRIKTACRTLLDLNKHPESGQLCGYCLHCPMGIILPGTIDDARKVPPNKLDEVTVLLEKLEGQLQEVYNG